MLIKALCDYYDILSAAKKVLPEGYSNVEIHYLVALTPEGTIDEILNWQSKKEIPAAKGKTKVKEIPRSVVMPQRTEKSGIEANIVEHRALYLFGLNLEKEVLTSNDRTNKARKSHEACVKENLSFLEGLDSPVVNAFRNFLLSWKPENETQNSMLLGLGKNYDKSKYAFCLSGVPEKPLHEDAALKEKWEIFFKKSLLERGDTNIAQCAVSGKFLPIARIHNKIKGVYGGLSTGSVLIGFNNTSENSYGNEQSYNSNISEEVMKKYTEALNYLLSGSGHKAMLDDMTIVFWAMNAEENCEYTFQQMLWGTPDKMNAERTENMLRDMVEEAKSGYLTEKSLQSIDMIQENVDFYMLGLKPNSSRLSVKFLVRKKYAEILWNIARFQMDLQVTHEIKPVYLSWIKKELVSPKSSNEKVNPALAASLFDAIVYESSYPEALLETVVRRVKTDGGKIKDIRAGLIKACINRSEKKEELKVALDKENKNPAYLCGRLFAVLEKLQQEASNNSLNRTIKDAYFSSAAAKPVLVFPKLVGLAQNHMKKVKHPMYYNKLIGEIVGNLPGEFPEKLLLQDQGRFIVGYYQQYESFFEKSGKTEDKNEMEEK